MSAAVCPCLRLARSRRGGIYFAVLGCSMLVALIGFGALAAVRAQRLGVLVETDMKAARELSRSAIEIAMAQMAADPNWRHTRVSGDWFVDRPLGDGTISARGIDPDDGDLRNNEIDPVVLTGIGRQGRAMQMLQVRLVCEPSPLSCLEAALASAGDQNHSSTSIHDSGQIISSNGTVASITAQIYTDVEALVILGGSYHNAQRLLSAPRQFPDAGTVFNYYKSAGSWISRSSLPRTAGVYTLDRVLLSPAHNPWGAINARGIYVIDLAGADIVIQNSRIYGTLVLLNPGANARLAGSMVMGPAEPGLPALMVGGDFAIRMIEDQLSESSGTNMNFNPPGAPYNGESDGDTSDSYPSQLAGLVYISGSLTTGNAPNIHGTVVVGGTVATSGSLRVAHDPAILEGPPPGFAQGPMKIERGSWAHVVLP
jgi:hypothetical protein